MRKPFHERSRNRARPKPEGEGRSQVRQHVDRRAPVASLDPDRPPIWGVHAVVAALANERRVIDRLLVTETAEPRLAEALRRRAIKPERVDRRDLDRLLGAETVHQGALLIAAPLPEATLADLMVRAAAGGPIIVLDQVTDPHNVGAILRSAAVFGAAGMVMTRRHSPPLGGALAKAASGALELVPVALVPNLARALDDLAEAGVRKIGLAADALTEIGDVPFDGPVALVLGAEGAGMRRLTQEHCDHLVRIGASGALASLNVSNAAAVALYAAAEARRR